VRFIKRRFFYLKHMHIEEAELLPAERLLSAEERHGLAFNNERDPLVGREYEALFSRIVQKAPAPLGAGDK